MNVVFNNTRSYVFTSSGTSPVRFSDINARLVVFTAPPSNTGTVTIVGWDSSATPPAADTRGVVLSAGEKFTWWCENLNQLAYILSVPNEVVTALVGT